MNQHFRKIAQFNFNTELLYNEWNYVVEKYNAIEICKQHFNPFYIELIIGMSSNMDPNFNPIIDRLKFIPKSDTSDIDFKYNQLLNIWKDTYTEQVLSELEIYFNNKKQTIYTTNYTTLLPNTVIPEHVDTGGGIRYFLLVSGENISTTACGITTGMNDKGGLYKLNTRVPHSVKNNGSLPRVALAFTTNFL